MEGIGREVLDDLALTGVLWLENMPASDLSNILLSSYEWSCVRKVLVHFVRKSVGEFFDNPIDEQFVKKVYFENFKFIGERESPNFLLFSFLVYFENLKFIGERESPNFHFTKDV